jgi:Family of unknown function (DUF6345)
MSRRVGSWWRTDGIDGRRSEAQGFGDRLNGAARVEWTEDNGDVGGPSRTTCRDDVSVLVLAGGGLLEHTSDNSVGRWIPAFERLRYLLGFHNASYSGGGQDPRAELFATYAAWLHYTTSGLFDMSLREAWAEANEIVEGPDVEWAYLRVTGPESDTYHEALRAQESPDPVSDRVFYTARGSC